MGERMAIIIFSRGDVLPFPHTYDVAVEIGNQVFLGLVRHTNQPVMRRFLSTLKISDSHSIYISATGNVSLMGCSLNKGID